MSKLSANIQRVLWIACPVLLFAVLLGHMEAIVNSGLALLGIGMLAAACSSDRPSLLRWPLLLPILLWAAWSLGATVGWSAFPKVSERQWFDEVVYPLLAFWGFWLFGSRVTRPARVVLISCWFACVLITLMSAIYWGGLQPPTPETFPLRFYARVGHTSTLAMFSLPLFTAFMSNPRWRAVGMIGVAMCVFIGLATLNRFFWPAIAITALIAVAPLCRRHVRLAVVVAVALCVAVLGSLELSARLRLGDHLPAVARDVSIDGHEVDVPKTFSALGDTLSSDTRPKLWAFYIAQGMHHPWTGIGFGKPLPGLVYGPQMPPELLSLEPQARTHAHNLFINTWLQAGVVGVALQAALLLCLIARFWRLRRVEPWVAAAGIALVVGMIAKNSTDDFMWRTTMLAFWMFAGFLLGVGERMAMLVAPGRRASRDSA
ncbi:O-antigen ligase family protein [Trinickia terrae]|uniref:O-antigen ligase family protein n=1 Tax=Trinickia terrae TaxID=2571161 RepID=A0A4U1HPE8_9BURK|nr:O-antigen ligase family protein [Trinickia terrae]TKC83171.1 O-antigen ligase family protein [Trinickia terrae]